ncbi:hypothetical protein [Cellulophaga algicola]|uniref:hypothetical protein n=1 Tax=Cellulophaga algicola TaxID=59600 RepID=UPI0005A08B38|nr:hypothetical protein [Cellulophaga algicola]
MKNSILIVSVALLIIACSSSTDKEDSAPVIPGTVLTCLDGIINGLETTINCGGTSSEPCTSGTVLLPESGYDAP